MRAAVVDQRVRPVIQLATSPQPLGYAITGPGAGYQAAYFGGDSAPSVIPPGGDGPLVDGASLGYVRKTITTAGTTLNRLTWQVTEQNGDVAPATLGALAVIAGHTYRISHYRRATVAAAWVAPTIHLSLRAYDALGAAVTSAVSAVSGIVVGEWSRHTAIYTVPAGTVALAIRNAYGFSGATPVIGVGDTSDVTGLIITDVTGDTTRDVPYHDGDTPGWRWLGNPNASASVGYPGAILSPA